MSDRRNENQMYRSPSKRFANARRGQAVSFANTQPPIRREPVKPLTEIMEEEMTKQTAREELVSIILWYCSTEKRRGKIVRKWLLTTSFQ